MSRKREPRRRVAFTLVELIVAIAIIGSLVAIIAPSVFRNAGDAKVTAARSQIEIFALALSAYRLDNDVFPTSAQGLATLRTPPAVGDAAANWRGPYVSKVIAPDPWGRQYVYMSPGRANPGSFDLYSLGRDGRIGGEGEDADLTSWGGPVVP